MGYTLKILTSHGTAAEITGLDLTQEIDGRVRAELNEALARYCILAFRDQNLSPEQFVRAGEIFGKLMRHHRKSAEIAVNGLVSEVRNVPVESASGKYLIQGESYHTDHSNDPIPPKATALHAVSLPSKGGDTQFVNVHNAYDDLPDSMRRRLEGLKAVHVFQSRYSPREIRQPDPQSRENPPPGAMHPLVRIHPESGRKFLYLNPVRMESIQGMPDDEAQALIKELMDHAIQSKYEYRHKWIMGDMVIWDNRCVMHQANADYDMREVRHLMRILVKGSLPANETVEGKITIH